MESDIRSKNKKNEAADPSGWKSFIIMTLVLALLFICLAAGMTIAVDPFFHYHAPLKGISYILKDERYQNDGIARNYEYDALITGSSMSENFRTSLADSLFGVKSVKTAFAGGYHKETCDMVERAVSYNPDLKLVIRSLDQGFAWMDPDEPSPGAPEASFLSNDDLLDDKDYIFNKSVLFGYLPEIAVRTAKGVPSDNFDLYGNYAGDHPCGKDHVIADMGPLYHLEGTYPLTDEEEKMLRENMEKNFLKTPSEHPEIQFYYFFPPYSAANWYKIYICAGRYDAYIKTMRIMTEMCNEYDNVHVFCFFDETDMVTDLDNYSDVSHYSLAISDMILSEMAVGSHELTKENRDAYWDQVEDFYENYDYKTLLGDK